MSAKTSKYTIFLIFLALYSFPYKSSSSSSAASPKYEVNLSDYLGNGSSPVTIHCTTTPSRETPTKVINWGEAFSFEFRTALGLYGQWTCDISSGDKKGSFLIFDVNRDKGRCRSDGLCLWRIYPDGLSLYIEPTNSFEKQFSW